MEERVRPLNECDPRPDRSYVLYWAQANRRVDANHGLAYAITIANRLDVPVLYYEALDCGCPQATDRVFTFILENVPETRRRLAEIGAGYVFYLRRTRSDPNDVFYRLAAAATAVVTDDYPASSARLHNSSVPGKLSIPYYAVDSSCVVPMSRLTKREYGAYTIRPKIKKALPGRLEPIGLPEIRRRFRGVPPAYHTEVRSSRIPELVAACDINHAAGPSLSFAGGRGAALRCLERFLEERLSRYGAGRNNPAANVTSDLSPYLRHGMISALETALAARSYGRALGISTEEFLEELIVRRELAFNFARHTEDPGRLENLPDWARKTLGQHDGDPRNPSYTLEQFEMARTHDPLWNAAQTEMRLRGKIHGYYRMYWGKKIIEWAPAHQEALDAMLRIHDTYALDGGDPNTYAGILWCFGLHDRPWKKRPVFGSIRYMSFDGMKRKTDVDAYISEVSRLDRTALDPHRIQ